MTQPKGVSLLVICFLVTMARVSFSQEITDETAMLPPPDAEITRSVPLREAPPGGFFFQKAPQIGTLDRGEEVEILDQQEIRTLFGSQHWTKVFSPRTGLGGWIYSGSEEASTYTKFGPAGVEG